MYKDIVSAMQHGQLVGGRFSTLLESKACHPTHYDLPLPLTLALSHEYVFMYQKKYYVTCHILQP